MPAQRTGNGFLPRRVRELMGQQQQQQQQQQATGARKGAIAATIATTLEAHVSPASHRVRVPGDIQHAARGCSIKGQYWCYLAIHPLEEKKKDTYMAVASDPVADVYMNNHATFAVPIAVPSANASPTAAGVAIARIPSSRRGAKPRKGRSTMAAAAPGAAGSSPLSSSTTLPREPLPARLEARLRALSDPDAAPTQQSSSRNGWPGSSAQDTQMAAPYWAMGAVVGPALCYPQAKRIQEYWSAGTRGVKSKMLNGRTVAREYGLRYYGRDVEAPPGEVREILKKADCERSYQAIQESLAFVRTRYGSAATAPDPSDTMSHDGDDDADADADDDDENAEDEDSAPLPPSIFIDKLLLMPSRVQSLRSATGPLFTGEECSMFTNGRTPMTFVAPPPPTAAVGVAN